MEEELRPLADAINAKAEERQAIETEIKREDEASKVISNFDRHRDFMTYNPTMQNVSEMRINCER